MKYHSPIWKFILKALDLMKDGFILNVGDRDTDFLFQPWLEKLPFFKNIQYIMP